MKDSVLGVVRHILTTAGGYFVSSGLVTADDITAAVGAIVTLVGVTWSVIEKRNR